MVHFKISGKKLYAYQADTYLGGCGTVDDITPEKLNYYKRKYGGKLKMKLDGLKPGAHIDIKAKVIEVFPLRKFLTCYNEGCGFKRSIVAKAYEGKCPQCGTKESKEAREGVWAQDNRSAEIEDESGKAYLDLWKDECFRIKVEDKVHIINGFCRRSNSGAFNVSSGRYGSIVVEKE